MYCNQSRCVKCVGLGLAKINCNVCNANCIKYGFTKTKQQRYFCKICKVTIIENYTYSAYKATINKSIIAFTKEGVGIRSIGRLLGISAQTVMSRIIKISKRIVKPIIAQNQSYEVDELRTYVGNKNNLKWLVLAINKTSKQIVNFAIGSRTNTTLKKVIDTLLLSNATKIYTDKLVNYASIIPPNIHSTKYRGTNGVERINLNFRTHLERLSRKTICFSKTNKMLKACVRIYCWA